MNHYTWCALFIIGAVMQVVIAGFLGFPWAIVTWIPAFVCGSEAAKHFMLAREEMEKSK